MTVFATVIAITKDLPDVEGDLKYNIKTFATELGVRGVSFLGMPQTFFPPHLYLEVEGNFGVTARQSG